MYFICMFLGGQREWVIPECCHSLSVGRENLENLAQGEKLGILNMNTKLMD